MVARLGRDDGVVEVVEVFDESDGEFGVFIRVRPDETSPAGSSGKPFLPDWDGLGVTPALETGAPRVLG